MTVWTLSPMAVASLADIYAYTEQTWGRAQADRYLGGLFEFFDQIADRTAVQRTIPPDFEVDGYFSRYEKHFFYWKIFDDGVVGVAAVLHTAMMQGVRLRAAFAQEFGFPDPDAGTPD